MAKPEYIERGAAKHAADLAFDMTETDGCRCLRRRTEQVRTAHE